MMEVNLSNMLFGGFVIEAINFTLTATKQCSKRQAWKQNTHTHNCECGVQFINEPEFVAYFYNLVGDKIAFSSN